MSKALAKQIARLKAELPQLQPRIVHYGTGDLRAAKAYLKLKSAVINRPLQFEFSRYEDEHCYSLKEKQSRWLKAAKGLHVVFDAESSWDRQEAARARREAAKQERDQAKLVELEKARAARERARWEHEREIQLAIERARATATRVLAEDEASRAMAKQTTPSPIIFQARDPWNYPEGALKRGQHEAPRHERTDGVWTEKERRDYFWSLDWDDAD